MMSGAGRVVVMKMATILHDTKCKKVGGLELNLSKFPFEHCYPGAFHAYVYLWSLLLALANQWIK